MRELKPLTISNSIQSAPSVLLTPEMEKFVFIQPLYPDFLLAQSLFTIIHKHFKVEQLKAGVFKLKEVKYICAEEPEGIIQVDDWMHCLWSSKRRFNRDRKSTRLNSSHVRISYAVFCLKKKKKK